MTCITRILGTGGNCGTGASNGQSYNLTYPGKWTVAENGGCAAGLVSPVDSNGVMYTPHYFSSIQSLTYEGCSDIDPRNSYDCLNGGCVPTATYGTPGKYANLSACQSGCAKDSPCTGDCIPSSEMAALQQAASNLQSRICK